MRKTPESCCCSDADVHCAMHFLNPTLSKDAGCVSNVFCLYVMNVILLFISAPHYFLLIRLQTEEEADFSLLVIRTHAGTTLIHYELLNMPIYTTERG